MILFISSFKSPFRVILGCLLFFSMLGNGQNLITNPSFESGMTGYNNLAAAPASATYAISTAVVQQGTQAYSVTVSALGTNGWDIQTLGPTVNLTVGQTYTLTFYAKSSTAGAVANILFQNAQYLSQSFTLTTTYTAYTWTFVALEASPSLRFQFNNAANVGKTIYLDNFSLPVPAPVNTSFNDTVSINTSLTYQTITGLGGGLCYYQNWLTAHPNKNQIYNLIFKDLGVTFLRFFNQNTYTANPNFAIDKELVTTATNLLGYTPKIMISSWSPPAGLKGNNSVNGTDQNPVSSAPYPTLTKGSGGFAYSSFGDWWKQSVLLYHQNGIYPDYISLQNEPNWNPGYEGCLFNATESTNIAGFPQALSALRTSINTISTNRPKILGPEVFGIGSSAFQNYVNSFLNANDADALCYHLYTGGNPQSPDSFNSNLAAIGTTSVSKSKQVFMSEYIGVTASQDGKDTLSNTLNLAWMIHNNLTQANASAYIFWDLIWGGKSADMIGLENPWTPSSWTTPNGYLVQQQFYALKQYTKFVRSGWLRTDAGNNSTNFRSSSYKSIDGDSMAVVILNVGNSVGKMGLNLGGFVASSGLIYQTNGTTLQCSNTGVYMAGSLLTLPARSITTITLNRNKNPLVSITSPGNNSTFVTPITIPLAVSATDPDGSVVSVKYYDNGNLIATLTTAAFNFNWSTAALGIHTLTAIAMDNSGGTATSTPVFVTVKAPCIVPSTVSGFTGTTTICGSGNLVISALPVTSATGYLWNTSGVSIVSGQNTASLTVGVSTVGGTLTVYPYNACGTALGTSITITRFPTISATVSILSSTNSICSGTGVTFTATGVNVGTAPIYTWFRNTISQGTGNTFSYTPSNGDVIRAIATAGGTLPVCLSGTPATSNGINMTVNPVQSATVSIVSSSTSVCSGTGVTFTAIGVNVGTAPIYTWFRNSISQGTGTTFSYTPSNGDVIRAIATAGGTLPVCLSGTPATSNGINMTVNPIQTSTVSIGSSSTSVCSGTGVTFTATGVNVGTAPIYTWFRNSISQGTGTTFSYAPSNGDVIRAIATAGGTLPVCLSGTPATSNGINMTVNPIQTSTVSIVSSSTSVCSGTGVTFTATGGNVGTAPIYTWFRNSISQGTGTTFTYTPSNGDVIRANATAGGTLPVCLSGTPATSNGINMTVNSIQTSTVSIGSSSTSVCSGTGVTFTATGVNVGTAPIYTWFRNSISQGTGTSFSYTPSNGDMIRAIATVGGTLSVCLSWTPATSNGINMTVNPIQTSTVSIGSSSTSVCSGTGVTFTATGVNVGTAPIYTWFRNSISQGTGTTFTYTPVNGDVIRAVATAGGTLPVCLANSSSTSNVVQVSVNPLIQSSVSISASANPTCSNTGVTYTASATNGGSNPSFVWSVNGIVQSGNGSVFNYTPSQNDQIIAKLTVGGALNNCLANSTATSNSITAQVTGTISTGIAIGANSSTSCQGNLVIFTATASGTGTSPVYGWYVNGNKQVSTNNSFSYIPTSGDKIVATMSPGGNGTTCILGGTATSTGITLTVQPNQTASVSILSDKTTLCSGNAVSLTATGTNVGTAASYTWFVNGQVQSQGNTFSYTPLDNDNVTVKALVGGSLPVCLSNTTASSNSVVFQVNPTVSMGLSIASNATTLCSGTGITFTATGVNGGSAPTYTWWVNGQVQHTGNLFTYNPENGDIVNATLLAGGTLPNCLINTTATSNGVSLTVEPCLKPQVGSITGPAFVATGTSNVTYSVPNVPGDSYQWIVPAGATITSGQGTNSITVDVGNSNSGAVTLIQTNANGSTQVQLFVTIGTPPTIASIVGPTTITEGSTGIIYSVTSLPGANYQWTVPSGATITSGQGTSSVTVDFGSSVSGSIFLTATNVFGTSTANLVVQTSHVTSLEIDIESLHTMIYPNPFQKTAEVKVISPKSDIISIGLYDMNGINLRTWSELNSPIQLEIGEGLASGVYTLIIKQKDDLRVVKLVKLN